MLRNPLLFFGFYHRDAQLVKVSEIIQGSEKMKRESEDAADKENIKKNQCRDFLNVPLNQEKIIEHNNLSFILKF